MSFIVGIEITPVTMTIRAFPPYLTVAERKDFIRTDIYVSLIIPVFSVIPGLISQRIKSLQCQSARTVWTAHTSVPGIYAEFISVRNAAYPMNLSSS